MAGYVRRSKREMLDLEINSDIEDRFFVESYHSNDNFSSCTCVCVLLLDSSLNSAYRETIIHVQIDLPSEYPFKPPNVRFLTPLFHQNIHNGILCSHILKKEWNHEKSVRWCLDQLHTMLVVEGRNFDHMNVCKNTNITRLRDQHYLMYDKLMQRCLGHELPSDTSMYDRHEEGECFTTWYKTHSFESEFTLQQKLDIHQLSLFQEISGELNAMTAATLKNFLAVSAPTNGLLFVRSVKNTHLNSTYKLEAVKEVEEEKCGSIEVIMPYGEGEKQLNILKYPCLVLLQNMEKEDSIRLPVSFTCVSKLLPLCNVAREAMEIRRLNPTCTQTLEDLPDSKEDLIDIIKAADFLGAEYITLHCCLKLNFMIKKESRDMVATAEATSSQKNAQFKTFITF